MAGTPSRRAEVLAVVIEHNALMLRVYVSETGRRGPVRLHHAVVDALLEHGMRGAATFRGIGGFGSHRRLSTDRDVDAFADFPILIEVVDDEERVRSFIPVLETLLDDGLVTLERVQRMVYRTGAST